MRLIDADELIKSIEQSRNNNPHKDCHVKRNHDIEHNHFIKMVYDQPTAFDKEKVIEELMKCSDDPCTLHECGVRSEYCSACMAKKAIEIVEKGGVKHD